MAIHIKKPAQIKASGNKIKIIKEFIGRVNSKNSEISVARMDSPKGWEEPGQTPEFDEYTLVFEGALQVKTRKNNTFGEPETFVTKQKQKNLVKAANNYMIRYKIDMEVRFDIVSVIMNSSGTTVNHIEAAFYPML